MQTAAARPKGPQKTRGATAPAPTPPAAVPRKGRPPAGSESARIREFPGVTVRVDPALLARIDAEVARRNAALAEQGAATSRGAVMAIALREFCDRAEAAAKGEAP